MSEITRGAIGMPFEMAMESELSRRQFHSIAQALLAERDHLKAENEALHNSLKGLIHASDATGWEQHTCGEIAKARELLCQGEPS